jgi:hypothetical protein
MITSLNPVRQMTTAYLLKSDKLIPLFDTVNKITLIISAKK